MKLFQPLFLLLLLSFSLISCKKDDEEKQETCRVSKIDFYDAGSIDFTASYIYTDNRLTRVEMPGILNYSFEYSSERITKRNFFQPGSTTASFSDQIFYNADGTISKIDRFVITGPSQTKVMSFEFTYTSGKINKFVISEINSSNTLVVVEEHTFIYTGNNITTLNSKYFDNGPTTNVTLTYAYDTNTNHLTKLNKQSILVDPLFIDPDASLIPFAFSTNNVKEVKSPGRTIPVEYNLDSRGNVSNYSFAGEKVAGFTYDCQ
jgi:hypothetical protein